MTELNNFLKSRAANYLIESKNKNTVTVRSYNDLVRTNHEIIKKLRETNLNYKEVDYHNHAITNSVKVKDTKINQLTNQMEIMREAHEAEMKVMHERLNEKDEILIQQGADKAPSEKVHPIWMLLFNRCLTPDEKSANCRYCHQKIQVGSRAYRAVRHIERCPILSIPCNLDQEAKLAIEHYKNRVGKWDMKKRKRNETTKASKK